MNDRKVQQGKELVILSGKGGTGKTSVAGGFTHLAQDAVFCDCDVDAANLGLLLQPKNTETHTFYASKKAVIDPDKCTACGKCFEVCRFDSLHLTDSGKAYAVRPLLCEGCGYCYHVCPEKAVVMEDALSGHWYVSDTDHGPFVHARLEPAEGNSGKLVSAVRLKAREIMMKEGKKALITDGPPGTGCPVIACVSGADLALVVTEPTLSGINDLSRILKVCEHFKVPALICINKHDIDEDNTKTVERMAREASCPVVGLIPYDEMVPEAMVNGQPATAYDCPAGESIKNLWGVVEEKLSTR